MKQRSDKKKEKENRFISLADVEYAKQWYRLREMELFESMGLEWISEFVKKETDEKEEEETDKEIDKIDFQSGSEEPDEAR